MKILLIPLAVIAFLVFLLVIGAIGLFIALAVIWVFGRIWKLIAGGGRLIGRGGRRISRRGARQRS